jgi:hypothetical protein
MNADADERNDWGFPPIEVTAHERANQTTNVDQSVNKTLPWVVLVAIVACSLGGAALGISIGARDTANRSERESRLQRLEIDEMKVALQVQGIKTHEGVKP